MARLPFSANYYELLGLSVSVSPRQRSPEIEAAIKALEGRKADGKTGNTGDEIALVLGKSLIKQMREDLAEEDVPIWKDHHANWKKRAKTVINGRAAQISQILGVLQTSQISKNARDLIAKEIGDLTLVEKALKKASVSIFEGVEPDKASGEIKGNLKRAFNALPKLAALMRLEGVADIWELLSSASGHKVTRTSNAQALKVASESIGKKNSDANLSKEIKAAYQILRNGSDNLLNNHDPKNPDAALNLFQALWLIERDFGLFAMLSAFQSTDRVGADQFERAAAACAKAAGLKQDKAREIMLALFAQKKINAPKFKASAFVPIKACPYCGTFMGGKDTKCSNCGQSPLVQCSNCKKKMDVGLGRCAACGVSVEQASRGREHIRNIDTLMMRNDYAAAEVELWKAQKALPDTDLRAPAEKLAKLRVQEYAEMQGLRELVLARKFDAAHGVLKRRKGGTPSRDWQDLKNTILAALTEARTHLDKAERSLGAGEFIQAADAASKALEIVADDTRAQDILDSIPPEPPTGLQAVVRDGDVHLKWTSSRPNDRAITFEVHRWVHGQGNKAQEIDTAKVSKYVDTSAPDGSPLVYSVYARRRRSRSTIASESKAVTVYKPVSDLTIEPILGAVTLRWKLPTNASFAQVRCHAENDRPHAPLKLAPIGTDAKLWKDTSNTIKGPRTYIVSACYGDPKNPRRGPSVSQTVTPQQAPNAIGSFRKTPDGILTWASTPGPQDKDEIWCFAPREALPKPDDLTDRKSLPKPLHVLSVPKAVGASQGRSFPSAALPIGNFRVVLARTQGTLTRISAPIIAEHVVPVKALRARQKGAYYEVTWDWPEEISKATVIVSAKVGGRAADVRKSTHTVNGVSGKPGLFRQKILQPANFEFSVCAVSRSGLKSPSESVKLAFDVPNKMTAKLLGEKTGMFSSAIKYTLMMEAQSSDIWPSLSLDFIEVDSEGKKLPKTKLANIASTKTRSKAKTEDLSDALKNKKGTLFLSFSNEAQDNNFVLENVEFPIG